MIAGRGESSGQQNPAYNPLGKKAALKRGLFLFYPPAPPRGREGRIKTRPFFLFSSPAPPTEPAGRIKTRPFFLFPPPAPPRGREGRIKTRPFFLFSPPPPPRGHMSPPQDAALFLSVQIEDPETVLTLAE